MKKNIKAVGAVLGSAAIAAAAGVAAAVPAFADAPAFVAEADAAQEAQEGQQLVANVEGEFAFTQDKLTDMGVFAKAAAAVCASIPDYAGTCTCMMIAIQSGDAELVATVQDMMADGEMETHIMGCACSSNVAGGGAVANVEVTGVTLESVAALVDAR